MEGVLLHENLDFPLEVLDFRMQRILLVGCAGQDVVHSIFWVLEVVTTLYLSVVETASSLDVLPGL